MNRKFSLLASLSYVLLVFANISHAEPPAGVIPYTCFNGGVYILLAYDGEDDRKGWGAFGGTALKGEKIYQTASREFHEETGCVFPVPSANQLKDKKNSNSDGFYTYVAEVPYVPPAVIEISDCGTKDKRKDWVWVSLPSLIQAIEQNTDVQDIHREQQKYPIWGAAKKSIQKALQDGLVPTNNGVCKNRNSK